MDAATRRHIQFRRDAIVRETIDIDRPGPPVMETHEDYVQEVEAALDAYRKSDLCTSRAT